MRSVDASETTSHSEITCRRASEWFKIGDSSGVAITLSVKPASHLPVCKTFQSPQQNPTCAASKRSAMEQPHNLGRNERAWFRKYNRKPARVDSSLRRRCSLRSWKDPGAWFLLSRATCFQVSGCSPRGSWNDIRTQARDSTIPAFLDICPIVHRSEAASFPNHHRPQTRACEDEWR